MWTPAASASRQQHALDPVALNMTWKVPDAAANTNVSDHAESSQETPSSSSQIKAQRGHRRYEIHPVKDVVEAGQICIPSSLWEKEVDAIDYEIGCSEIEVLSRRVHCVPVHS